MAVASFSRLHASLCLCSSHLSSFTVASSPTTQNTHRHCHATLRAVILCRFNACSPSIVSAIVEPGRWNRSRQCSSITRTALQHNSHRGASVVSIFAYS
jgi:hypothetical protein